MFGPQAINKGLMRLEETVILDGGCQRLAFHEMVRIPTKPAANSERKPATDSDLKPAGIPI